jgi:hypothetical protein
VQLKQMMMNHQPQAHHQSQVTHQFPVNHQPQAPMTQSLQYLQMEQDEQIEINIKRSYSVILHNSLSIKYSLFTFLL